MQSSWRDGADLESGREVSCDQGSDVPIAAALGTRRSPDRIKLDPRLFWAALVVSIALARRATFAFRLRGFADCPLRPDAGDA
jgi:hypothetical protein